MRREKNISCRLMSVREKRRWSFRMVNVTGLEEEKDGGILKCLRSEMMWRARRAFFLSLVDKFKYRWPARFRGRTQFLREWRYVQRTFVYDLHSFFYERVSIRLYQDTFLSTICTEAHVINVLMTAIRSM